MVFSNDAEFQDDFRKVGQDATADLERPGSPSDPTEHASSENLDVAAKADDLEDDDELEDDDLEDDEDDELEEEDDEDEDEEDDDLEDEDDDLDDEDDEELDEEDEDDEELEDDPQATQARLMDAESRAR